MKSKRSVLLLPCAFILLTFTHSLIQPSLSAASLTIVISEFRTRGPNGGNDEFIEPYNLSSSPVNIRGWQVKGSSSSGTVSTRAVINNGITLNPGCHYLITNSNPTGGPYSGSVGGNQNYSVGTVNEVGIALTLPDGTIFDQMGMSSGSAFKKGSTLSPLTSDSNKSYERRLGGPSGSSTDTDNNGADFRPISPSDPQNAASSCIGEDAPTNPSGFGNAPPQSVGADNTTLLTVDVSPSANPTSTGILVTGDLSAIGGGASQQFFNDGTNGDATAGDSIFSYQATITPGIAAGQKNLSITITEAQARTGSALITLTLQSAGVGQCGIERWSVKTATDLDASKVDLSALMPTILATMRNWPKPTSIPEDKRIAPYETIVWVVNAALTQYKLREDSDHHLILQDDQGRTIITEIACPCCVEASSPFASLIANARTQFDAWFTATSSFQIANITVRVTGVGMFDFLHGQTGVAPNGIELHPVLDIKVNINLHAPVIINACIIDGKKLLVSGLNFDDGAKIYLDDEKQKTKNDEKQPTLLLIAKKAGKKIGKGQTVTLQKVL